MVSEIALATDFAIILVTATAVGFLAKRTRQPTIVAYILTGIVLGPVFLDVVTEEGLVELMAELGLGFLLFLLGIKMRLEDVREILRPIVSIAGWQTVLQTALALSVAWALGFSRMEVLIIALATVFGATPIIVKILRDKDELSTMPGKIDVGVLIVQDIYLVFVLALVGTGSLEDPTAALGSLAVITVMIGLIGVFSYLSSRYLLPRLFRRIADSKDVFFVVAFAWAFLFIVIAEQYDLSVEVGAFLAGISLAQLPYSKELEDRIAPVTDFFILVFFVSIGLRLAADDLAAYWVEAVVASAVLMVGNFWIMFYLIDRQGFSLETTFLGSANMIQVSEFSLVVGALAVTQEYVGEPILGYLSLMALLTMSLSTYVITWNHALYRRMKPFLSRWDGDDGREIELHPHENHAVVVGYDDLSYATLPVLEREYGEVVVVDPTTDHVGALEDDGEYATVYGDIRHEEIRKEAGLADASFVFSSTPRPAVNRALLSSVDDRTTTFVEAEWIDDARELYEAGATYVVMSTHLTAERLADRLDRYFAEPGAFEDGVSEDLARIRDRSPSETDGDRDE